MGLEKTLYDVREDVGVVEVCALMSMNRSRTNGVIPFFNVSLLIGDDTGTHYMSQSDSCDSLSLQLSDTSDDYCAVSSVLIFDSSWKSCVFVSIVDDSVVEGAETFNISLERTSDLDRWITLSPNFGNILIDDNDGVFS